MFICLGQIELSTREGYASSNLPLPIFHRILWYIANISANVSLGKYQTFYRKTKLHYNYAMSLQ